jgi:hypothetical protein
MMYIYYLNTLKSMIIAKYRPHHIVPQKLQEHKQEESTS